MLKQNHLKRYLGISFFFLFLSFFSFHSTVFAQEPSSIVPSPFCLGDCPTTVPTEMDTPDAATIMVPTEAAAPVEQLTTAVSPQPTLDPCEAENMVNVQTDHHHEREDSGAISDFVRELIEFLIQIIELIRQLLGGGTIAPPTNPDPAPAPDPETPTDPEAPIDPCDPETEPTLPGDQPTVAPTTGTTPGTSTAPIPSSGSAIPTAPAAAACSQAEIQKLVDSVSQANIEANLRALVQDDSKPTPNELISRHVSAPGNQIKVDWAKQQLGGYGLQIVEQQFESGGRNLNNVVGRIAGSDPNSLYAVGGHIDSISEDEANVAPGANDDGSGVVVAMEVGRVLKGFASCLKSSVDIVGWNDEEEEMGGSTTYVESVSGKTFKGAVSMDMIGYAPDGECIKSDVNTGQDPALSQKIVEMNAKYNIGLDVTAGTQDDMGDDAGSFWDANLPAVYVVECSTETNADNDPGYHKTTDRTTNVTFSQLTKTAKLLVAAIAELASQ